MPATARGFLEIVFSGFLVGALTGIVDAVLAHLLFDELLSPRALISAAAMYSALWVLVGLSVFFILVLWSLFRPRPSANIFLRTRPLLLFSCLSIFLLGFTIINKKYLPVAHSPVSLGFDLAWLVFWTAVYVFFRHRARKAEVGRRRLPVLGALSAVAFLVLALAGQRLMVAPAREKGPNIILLLIDNVRADHLGCYGYGRPTSPRIDDLSGEGVLFSHAYVAAPWTLPSVVSLLTSRYPTEHGTINHRCRLSGEVPTFLGQLKERGYQVGIFSNSPWISPRYGIGREVDHFERPYLSIHYVLYFLDKYSPFRLDSRWFERFLFSDRGLTVRFLDWAAAVTGHQGRFFAYLHLMGPHLPYAAPPGCREQLGLTGRPRLNPPGYGGFLSFTDQPPLSDVELEELVGSYDAALLHSEEVVGLIVAGLKKMGAYGDTVIIVTADHGEEFYEHRGWYHGDSLFEELLRVPLIMTWPGRLPPNSREDCQISHIDLGPMIVYLADHDRTGAVSLPDLVEHARASRRLGEDLIYSEVIFDNRGGRSVREGRYKLIHGYHDDGHEAFLLFDLESDPGETNNLILEEPEAAARLGDLLRDFHSRLLANRAEIEEAQVDHLTDRKLRSLGYLR